MVVVLALAAAGVIGFIGFVSVRAADRQPPVTPPAGVRTPAIVRAHPGTTSVAVPSAIIPNGLVAGTCLAFAPTGRDRRQTVFVDPGHGGPDPGAVGPGALEKDLALAVALKLRDQLVAAGYRVVLARTADTSVARLLDSQVRAGAVTESGSHLDTQARIACANAAHANVLVSIHFDAFDDPSVGGAETIFDDAREFATANGHLATLLQAGMEDSFARAGWNVDDRGVISDAETGSAGLTAAGDSYGRLMELGPAQAGWNDVPSAMPGALVEPLFITNPAEAAIARSAEGQVAIAAGLADGIGRFLATSAAASAG